MIGRAGGYVSLLPLGILCTLTMRCHCENAKPNIIVVLTGALGWSDVSFHGLGQIPTPNLDTLALNGIPFKQLYTQPSSSASRGCFFTGKYVHKIGLQDMFLLPGIKAGLAREHKIMPEYLRELGYETHMVGTWHLGYYSPQMLPTARGFDTFYGSYLHRLHYYNLTYREPLWSNASMGFDFHLNSDPFHRAQGHHIVSLMDIRVDFLLKQRQKPMFLVVSHVAPGGTVDDMAVKEEEKFHAHIRHIVHDRRTAYASVIQSLDASIGRLIESLQTANMLNNSVVVFMSTTGGRSLHDGFEPVASSNWPLRGQRFSFFEGGIRSTSLIWSPLLRDRGYGSDKLYHIVDWLPTFVRLAGGDLSSLQDHDGYDIWASLSHQEQPSPRSHVIHQIDTAGGNMFVARIGRYKVLSNTNSIEPLNVWFPPQGEELHADKVDFLLPTARTYRVLSETSGFIHVRQGWRRDNIVHCNPDVAGDLRYIPRIDLNLTQCFPEKEACLFDVVTDPCEFENLAKDLPQQMGSVRQWMERYVSEAVHPVMTFESLEHFDPRADPKLHGGPGADFENSDEMYTKNVEKSYGRSKLKYVVSNKIGKGQRLSPAREERSPSRPIAVVNVAVVEICSDPTASPGLGDRVFHRISPQNAIDTDLDPSVHLGRDEHLHRIVSELLPSALR